MFKKKYLENADLIIPFTRCSLGDPVDNCPFIKYWDKSSLDEQLEPLLQLSDAEINQLRSFHQKCLLERSKGLKKYSQKENQL